MNLRSENMFIQIELTEEEYKIVLQALDFFGSLELGDEDFEEQQVGAIKLLDTLEELF